MHSCNYLDAYDANDVGTGLSSDLDECTLSSASKPEAIAVAAIVLSVVYIVFLSVIILSPFRKTSLFVAGLLQDKNKMKDFRNSKFATSVDLTWLGRRRLTIYVCPCQHLQMHQARTAS